MDFYDAYKSIPELASLPREQARAIWFRSLENAPAAPPRASTLFVTLPVLMLPLLGIVLVRFDTQGRYILPFVFLLALSIPCRIYIHLRRRREQTEHLRFLIRVALGHQCGRCFYDLSGNTSGTCPECGTAIPAQPTT